MNAPLSERELALWSKILDDNMCDYRHDVSAVTATACLDGVQWTGGYLPPSSSLAHTAPLSRAVPLSYGGAQAHTLSEHELACIHLALQSPTYGALPTHAHSAAFGNVQGWTEAALRHSVSEPVPSIADYQRLPGPVVDPLAFWTKAELLQPAPQQLWTNPEVPALAQNDQTQASTLDLYLGQNQAVAPSESMSLPASVTRASADSLAAPHLRRANAYDLPEEVYPAWSTFDLPSCDTPNSSSSFISAVPSPSDSTESPSAFTSFTSDLPPLPTPTRRQPRRTSAQNSGKVPLPCTYPGCTYATTTDREVDLNRHCKSRHLGWKPWVCCGFPIGTHPDAHERGDGEVRMIDNVAFVGGCGKRYSRRDSLLRHLNGTKPKGKKGHGGNGQEAGKPTTCVGDAHAKWQLGTWLP